MTRLLLVVGIVALGVAIWLASDSLRLVRKGLTTDGQVARVTQVRERDLPLSQRARKERTDPESKNEVQFTAFVEYKVDDKPFTLERRWTAKRFAFLTWPNYQQGDRLKVIYLPADPTEASINSVLELFFGPVFLMLFGLVCAALGIVGLLRSSSKD